MDYVNNQITLDMHSVMSQVSISAPQFDTARRISATLTEGGKAYRIPDGCRAVFTGTKADGTQLLNDCIIERNTVIRYDFTAQTTAAVGRVDCVIKLYGEDGGILSTPRLTLVVYEGTGGDVVVSEDEKNAIDTIFITEQARAAAEEDRAEAEAARAEAEESRVTAEEERVRLLLEAEASRSEAESGRVVAEEAREAAEAIRKAAEEGRVEAIQKAIAGALEIVDDLETDDPGRALSAAQGVVLKGMVDSKAPMAIASQTDITAGTTALATGQDYLVYE